MPDKPEDSKGIGAAIDRGLAIAETRTRNLCVVAAQKPRDLKLFESRLIESAAEGADDMFFRIPFKNHKQGCQNRRYCDCPEKIVSGKGIGLAREAARLYGNLSVSVEPDRKNDDADDHWIIRCTVVDLENTIERSNAREVAKMDWAPGGGQVRVYGKAAEKVYAAGAAKIERDTILQIVPRHITDRAYLRAQQADAENNMPIDQQIARLVPRFEFEGVELWQLQGLVKCKLTEVDLKAQGYDPKKVCGRLRGLLTGLRGGELTVFEVFGDVQQEEPAPKDPEPAREVEVPAEPEKVAEATITVEMPTEESSRLAPETRDLKLVDFDELPDPDEGGGFSPDVAKALEFVDAVESKNTLGDHPALAREFWKIAAEGLDWERSVVQGRIIAAITKLKFAAVSQIPVEQSMLVAADVNASLKARPPEQPNLFR